MNDLLNNETTLPEFGPTEARVARPRRRTTTSKAKPKHYKVICISMYTEDIDELESKVAALKRRGLTKVSKSQLIRIALAQLDIDGIVRCQY